MSDVSVPGSVAPTAGVPSPFWRAGKRFVTRLVVGLALVLAPASVLGVTQAKPAGACTLNTPSFSYYAQDPRLEAPNIWFTGGVDSYPDWFCGNGWSGVYAQTVACGVFGCNWEIRNRAEGVPNSAHWQQTPGIGCRSGTNRYRTMTQYYVNATLQVPGGGQFIAFSPNSPEFSCK